MEGGSLKKGNWEGEIRRKGITGSEGKSVTKEDWKRGREIKE